MNNRKRIEADIKAKYPDAEISHKVAMPFTVIITDEYGSGKRDCLPGFFFCPSCIKICSTERYASEEYTLTKAAGAPQTATMSR